MKTDEYPVRICADCATAAEAKMPNWHVATFHPDVCDVCNRWKSVTEPRDYGYPKVKAKRDKDLILHELCKAGRQYRREGNDHAAQHIEERMKELE